MNKFKFNISYVKINPSDKKKEKTIVKRKWEEEGIFVSKYMNHPDCPFCGLTDDGKEAKVRPTQKHMVNCSKRQLIKIPVRLGEPLKGTFKGQGLSRQLRYPIRVVFSIKEKDEKGVMTGEEKLLCSYRWKTSEVIDHIWNGKEWVPYYEWR